MHSVTFVLLVAAGSLGILLSFVQARSRAVLAEDGFAEPGRRAAAMALLGGVLFLVVAIPFAGGIAGSQAENKGLSLVSVFAVHAVLVFFLVSYYALSGRRSLVDFLRLRSEKPGRDLAVGVIIGVGGWIVTILTAAMLIGFWYIASRRARGEPAGTQTVSPVIFWILAQPLWVKLLIVASAMVVEELFFRSFLQTRVGPVAATLMFTAAHGAYGQPLVLVGILVIGAVLAVTFAIYRNVLPCIVAHGVFDSIQMFVIIPMVLKAVQAG